MSAYFRPPTFYPLSAAAPSAIHDDYTRDSYYTDRTYPHPSYAQNIPSRPLSYSSQPIQIHFPLYPHSVVPAMQPRSSLRPIPPALLDDPAFSTDPRSHPHFAMTSREDIVPVNGSALQIQSSQPDISHHTRGSSSRAHHPRLSQRLSGLSGSQPQFAQPPTPVLPSAASSLRTPRGSVVIPTNYAPSFPQPHPASSMAKLSKPNVISASSAYSNSHESHEPSSFYAPWVPYSSSSYSSSTTSSSPETLESSALSTPSLPSSSPLNVTPSLSKSTKPPPTEEIVLLPPPAYTEIPTEADRPVLSTNVSAPEIRPPPREFADVPPRPMTTSSPASAPQPASSSSQSHIHTHNGNNNQPPQEAQRTRSRRPSIVAPPKDLDRIDELDESDPLGFAWHHEGPYQAIKANLSKENIADIDDTDDNADPSKSGSQRDRKKSSHRKPPPPAVDPNTTSFGVSPGQIFPPTSFNPYQPPSQFQSVPLYKRPPTSFDPYQSQSRPQVRPQQQEQQTYPLVQTLSSNRSHDHERSIPFPEPQHPVSQPTRTPPQQATPPNDESELAYHLPNPYDYVIPPALQTSRSRLRQEPPVTAQGNAPVPMMTGPQRVRFENQSSLSSFSHLPPSQSSQAPPQRYPRTPSQDQDQTVNRANSAPQRPIRRTPPPPGLPSRAPSPQLPSRSQNVPLPAARSDTSLPSRHHPSLKSGSSMSHPAPHYLPKRLVMPTPLQSSQPLPHQNLPPSGPTSSNGHTPGYASSGNIRKDPLASRHVHLSSIPQPARSVQQQTQPSPPQQQQQQQHRTRAQEIPIHGRNLLRKRTTTNIGGGTSNPVIVDDPPPPPGNVSGGPGPGYVPSSNASAALFASRVTVGVKKHAEESGGIGGMRVWEKTIKARDKEKEKYGEKEVVKEKTGRKLSKRR